MKSNKKLIIGLAAVLALIIGIVLLVIFIDRSDPAPSAGNDQTRSETENQPSEEKRDTNDSGDASPSNVSDPVSATSEKQGSDGSDSGLQSSVSSKSGSASEPSASSKQGDDPIDPNVDWNAWQP